MSALRWLSTAALPVFILLTLGYSFAKKRDPYEAFIEGAKGGAGLVFQTMPYVIAMVFAVEIFKASGLFEALGRLLAPVLGPLGIPPEVVPHRDSAALFGRRDAGAAGRGFGGIRRG